MGAGCSPPLINGGRSHPPINGWGGGAPPPPLSFYFDCPKKYQKNNKNSTSRLHGNNKKIIRNLQGCNRKITEKSLERNWKIAGGNSGKQQENYNKQKSGKS
jgi:hypothetical protein